jgi:restriction endonuclease Mrr
MSGNIEWLGRILDRAREGKRLHLRSLEQALRGINDGRSARIADAMLDFHKVSYRTSNISQLLSDNDIEKDDYTEQIAEFPLPDSRIAHPLSLELIEVGEEFLRHFLSCPEDMQRLSPKRFEDLIEAIFRNQNFDVERIGSCYQADGGVDLIAVSKNSPLGFIRIAIQCKTISPNSKRQKVSAKPVRELHGVLDKYHAHKGIITTTAEFTKEAWEESSKYLWRISLEDRQKIISRIRSIFPESLKI